MNTDHVLFFENPRDMEKVLAAVLPMWKLLPAGSMTVNLTLSIPLPEMAETSQEPPVVAQALAGEEFNLWNTGDNAKEGQELEAVLASARDQRIIFPLCKRSFCSYKGDIYYISEMTGDSASLIELVTASNYHRRSKALVVDIDSVEIESISVEALISAAGVGQVVLDTAQQTECVVVGSNPMFMDVEVFDVVNEEYRSVLRQDVKSVNRSVTIRVLNKYAEFLGEQNAKS